MHRLSLLCRTKARYLSGICRVLWSSKMHTETVFHCSTLDHVGHCCNRLQCCRSKCYLQKKNHSKPLKNVAKRIISNMLGVWKPVQFLKNC